MQRQAGHRRQSSAQRRLARRPTPKDDHTLHGAIIACAAPMNTATAAHCDVSAIPPIATLSPFSVAYEHLFVYDRCMDIAVTRTASECLALDVASLSDAAVRELFLEARAEADRWELVCARLAAAVDQRGIPNEDGATSTPMWMQHHSGQHRAEAKQSVNVGRALAEFPAVGAAWASGTISASAARRIIAGRCPGAESEYAALEPILLEFAHRREYRTLNQAISYYFMSRFIWMCSVYQAPVRLMNHFIVQITTLPNQSWCVPYFSYIFVTKNIKLA